MAAAVFVYLLVRGPKRDAVIEAELIEPAAAERAVIEAPVLVGAAGE